MHKSAVSSCVGRHPRAREKSSLVVHTCSGYAHFNMETLARSGETRDADSTVNLCSTVEIDQYLQRTSLTPGSGGRMPWFWWEDALLRVHIKWHGGQWRRIKRDALPWRTDDSLRNRFNRVICTENHAARRHGAPSHRGPKSVHRRAWTVDEDSRLRALCVSGRFPRNVAAHFPGRDRQAVRNRAYRREFVIARPTIEASGGGIAFPINRSAATDDVGSAKP